MTRVAPIPALVHCMETVMNRSRIEVAVFLCGLALLWGVVGEVQAQLSTVQAPAAKLYRFPDADTNDDSQPSVVWYVSGDHRPESGDPAGGQPTSA